MREILFVDAALEDLDQLLELRRSDVRVVTVPATADAHAALADALAERPSSLHLVAHGAPGQVRLGARPITADSIADRFWPDASGTEILLHACDAGAGKAGGLLLTRLTAATGAAVAAASHPVGSEVAGASWDLDVATAAIRTPALFDKGPFGKAESWPHRLAYTGTPTNGNDTLTGDNSGNTINGLGGNDSIRGGTGTDSLVGGAGNDTLIGGGNPGGLLGDTLNGGLGADSLVGGSGFNVVTYEDATAGLTLDMLNPANSTGEAAGDVFVNIQRWIGSNFSDRLVAGNGPVWFWGHDGNDVEYGSAFNDTLEAGNGDDTVHGGGGDDLMFGRADNDMVYGEAGNDTIGGGAGNDLVDGGDGNDVIFGDWGNDTLTGGIGNDTFYAGEVQSGPYSETQADTINGGDGNDTYLIGNQIEAATVRFDGGAGTDTLSVNSDGVTDPEGKVTSGTPQINLSQMVLTSVETLALSGSRHHAVTMTGGQANGFNGITGATQGDVFAIVGASLSGTVTSGNGSQLAAGHVQAETVNGVTLVHIGMDSIPGGDVTLRIAGSFAASGISVAGNAVTLVTSSGGGTGGGTGGGAGQVVTGTSARDYLAGGTGNDTITGGAGNDYMEGGTGSDSFVLTPGDGWDYVSDFQTGSAGDVLDLHGWSTMTSLEAVLAATTEDGTGVSIDFGPADGVRLNGVTKASLTAGNFVLADGSGGGSEGGSGGGTGGGTGGGAGGTGGQTLTGTGGNDYLAGGAANDTITGGAGNDYMMGGGGSDIFVEAPGAGWDCIGDFTAGNGGDVLNVRAFSSLTSFAAVMSHANQDGGDTTIDFNGNTTMRLVGVDHTQLTAANFLCAGS